MQTTFEQIIEAARRLSPEEIEKLGEWVRRQQAGVGSSENEKNSGFEEEIGKFKAAREWIEKHREEYLGQWVCLEGDELISHGFDAIKVHNEAKSKGIKAPFLEQIVEEPEYYGGGIELCQ